MALPDYVKNVHDPNREANDMDDATALANGNFLVEYMKHYLNNNFDFDIAGYHISILPGFRPTDSVDAAKRAAILAYFSTDDKKRWLGRQLYLLTGFNGVKVDDTGDDTPYLLNWLFRRPAATDMGLMLRPSQLPQDLRQNGGRMRRTRRRRQRRQRQRSQRQRR